MTSSYLDWLPYVDAPITDSEKAAAQSLVDAELKQEEKDTTQQHPSMNDEISLSPTAMGQDLIDRASRGEKLSAIDMTRYESGALEPPSSTPADPEHLQSWRDTVTRAATLHSYLAMRGQNLALLESFGKNAWLVGNDQSETELKALEKTLAETKEHAEAAERQRRTLQEASKGEIDALQAEWRRRIVGKTKTEIATAEIEEEIAALQKTR